MSRLRAFAVTPSATAPLFLDVFGGPKRQRLNGQRRIKSSVGHEDAAISYKEVIHVMALAVAADDRSFSIVAHPASAVLVVPNTTLPISATPGSYCACLFQQQFLFVHDEIGDVIVNFHQGMCDASDWHAPRVAHLRIEVHAVCFLRHCLAVAAQVYVTTKIFSLKFFVSFAPHRFARRAIIGELNR